MIRVECTCFAAPLLGALDYGLDRWRWWPIEEPSSALAALKRAALSEGNVLAKVSSGEVPLADAAALGFLPGIEPSQPVAAEDALRHKTGIFGQLTTNGWLRSCPACRRVPEITRRDLYAKADAALAEGERTIAVI